MRVGNYRAHRCAKVSLNSRKLFESLINKGIQKRLAWFGAEVRQKTRILTHATGRLSEIDFRAMMSGVSGSGLPALSVF